MICFSDGTNQNHIYQIAKRTNISDLQLGRINLNGDQRVVLNQLLSEDKSVGDLLRDNYGFDENGIIRGSGRYSQGTPDRIVSLFLSQNFAQFGFEGYAANFIKKDKNGGAFHAELMLFNPIGLVSTTAEFKQKSPENIRVSKRARLGDENDDDENDNPLTVGPINFDALGGNLKRYYISYNNAY